MGAIIDLLKSERGFVLVALIIASSALVITGSMSVADWTEYTKWVFATYVAGKTVTGAVGMFTQRTPPAPTSPTSTTTAKE